MASIPQLLGVSGLTSVLLRLYAPPAYHYGIVSVGLAIFIALFLLQITWSVIIYPKFLSPLRHLPTPADNAFFTGQTKKVYREAGGRPMREWIENVPNDGLITYSNWFRQRVLVTNPKTLAEVLVQKNYEFIKPSHFREGLARILGVGILLAEGDEHKRQRKDLMPVGFFWDWV